MDQSNDISRRVDVSHICAILVSVVMVIFLLAQGLPYYHYGEGASTSLFAYIAMPGDYPALESHLAGLVEGYSINGIVGICILLQVMAIAGMILIWRYKDNLAVMTLTGATGLTGLIGYSTNAALRLGGNVRILYYWLFAIMLVLSLYCIISKLVPLVKERKQVKAAHGKLSTHNV